MVRTLLMLVALSGAVSAGAEGDPQQAVRAVLDALHEKASAADFEGYFALYASNAVFLGTDRDEYWPLAEFKRYTRERFAAGTGWTYRPVERFVHVNGDTAWFEERLHHARYGQTRGTGVLVREDGAWRIAQYNLTLPIPNELFVDVAANVKRHYGEDAAPTDSD